MPRYETRFVRTPRSIWKWILRGIAGLAIGYAACTLAMALWFAFGALCYGSSEFMNKDLKGREGMPYLFMAITSSLAPFSGCCAGLLFLGVPNGRWNRPILICSLFATLYSTALGAWFGFAAGLIPEFFPEAMREELIWAPFVLAVPVGILGGWLAAHKMTKRITVEVPDSLIEQAES